MILAVYVPLDSPREFCSFPSLLMLLCLNQSFYANEPLLPPFFYQQSHVNNPVSAAAFAFGTRICQ